MRIKGLEELDKFAQDFVSGISATENATVVGLKGDLGSGKTTFTQFTAKALGISDVITSPTFVIQKRYKILANDNFDKLIHIDAYRLDSGDELSVLDWEEISKDPKNLILIEWPEKVEDVLGEIKIIEFEYINEQEREVNVK